MRGSALRSVIRYTSCAVMWFVLASMIHASDASAASFRGLGDLTGGDSFSEAYAISGDGSTVVGFSYSASGREAFRWTEEDEMVGLGDLPGGQFNSQAYGVSVDGTIVVGFAKPDSHSRAFRWTSGGGMVALDGIDGVGLDVCANGSVIPGFYLPSASHLESCSWVWGDLTPLGYPPGYDDSLVHAVSDDCSIIVGYASVSVPYASQAFIWTPGEGWVGLGYLKDDDDSSGCVDISGDGSVIVGRSGSIATDEWEAFLWTASGGMVGLGDVYPLSISGDGSIVLGETSDGGELLLWEAVRGWRPLGEILEDDLGLDVSGWTLYAPYIGHLVSDDGLRITGIGTDPNGNTQAWIADLSSGPEPVPTISLPGLAVLACSLALGGLLSTRRRHTKA